MSHAQYIASDPTHSVWVSANAGTGKTKVLVDRVLRLVLDGVSPEKIVCITFTKAAAHEMRERIIAKAASWITLSKEELQAVLTELCGAPPGEERCVVAKQLFLRLIDQTEQLRIQTIHSLCQSILQQFPLEAGIPAGFKLMDERSEQAILEESVKRLFNHVSSDDKPMLADALTLLAEHYSEFSFHELMKEAMFHREAIMQAVRMPAGVEQAIDAIYETLNVQPGQSEEDIIVTCLRSDETEQKLLKKSIGELRGGSKTDEKIADALAEWQARSEKKLTQFSHYKSVFLTEKNQPTSRFISSSFQKDYPDLAAALSREQERVHHCQSAITANIAAQLSAALLVVVKALLVLYEHQKQSLKMLDYYDLLFATRDLLHQHGLSEWVLYKMGGRIEHVLIDEAQDTSPIQWEIVKALTDEFFAPDQQTHHSLMVVGDVKQSIYSFQGAKPASYLAAREHYAQTIQHSGHHHLHDVLLERSFRSVPEVLSVVDKTFSNEELTQHVTMANQPVHHDVYRKHEPGRVECWPLVSTEKEDVPAIWDVSEPHYELCDNATVLAQQMAERIAQWVESGRVLPSKAKPVVPGDIMVLVRRRNHFIQALMKALREKNIAVQGSDRINLNNHLAVRDLLALAQFTLLPEDDLSLACLLKSPLIGLSEEGLQQVGHRRGNISLWQSLKRYATEYQIIIDQLECWRMLSREHSPASFFFHVLEVQGMRRVTSAYCSSEVQEIYDEFLLQCQLYEQSHHPSMQGFVSWFSDSHTDIKREQTTQVDAVRIMTIHGAKGLQAPIVFLPDTTQAPTSQTRIWPSPSRDGTPLLFLSPPSHTPPEMIQQLKQAQQAQTQAEYWRLLYVAMTRAEDELYICGWEPGKKTNQLSWYDRIAEAMKDMECDEQEGALIHAPQGYEYNESACRDNAMAKNIEIPDWYHASIEQEHASPCATPSHSQKEVAKHEALGVRRGSAIHYLLEVYAGSHPQLSDLKQALRVYNADLPREEIQQWAQETHDVLNDESVSHVFSGRLHKEQPLSGVVNGAQVNGVIDCLVMDEQNITIIDYKTDRNVPENVETIPDHYMKQLATYRALLAGIYPEKTIQCVLLWTCNATHHILPDALLEDALQQPLDSDAA